MNMKTRKSATLKINSREQQRPALCLLRDLCLVSGERMVRILLLNQWFLNPSSAGCRADNIPINNCLVFLVRIYLAYYYSVFVQCSRCPNKRLKAWMVIGETFLVQIPACHTPHLFSWYQKHSAQLSRELL